MNQKPLTYPEDLNIPCPHDGCNATTGERCNGIEDGLVHFGRRLKRVMIEKGLYNEDLH